MASESEYDWLHAEYLHMLGETVRAELWTALGTQSPLNDEELWPWVHARWYEQRLEGERLTLGMPPLPAGVLPASPPTRISATGTRIPFLAPWRGGWPVSVFAGVDLTDDLSLWPAEGRWGRGDASAEKIQALALVALAATNVQEVTGCTPAEATAFLLCDRRFSAPGLRVSIGEGYGLHLWSPGRLLTVEELGKQYANARQTLGLGWRAKQPEKHTGELIDFVRRLRPNDGGGARWAVVCAQWNELHPEHQYADDRSISQAYRNAVEVRQRKGMLFDPDRTGTSPEGGL